MWPLVALEHYVKACNASYNTKTSWFKNKFLLKSSLKISHVIQLDKFHLQIRK